MSRNSKTRVPEEIAAVPEAKTAVPEAMVVPHAFFGFLEATTCLNILT